MECGLPLPAAAAGVRQLGRRLRLPLLPRLLLWLQR